MSRYRVKGLPWSNGIGTHVDGCHTSQEVMQEAGLNWIVKKCELMAQMPFTFGGDNTITDVDKLNGVFAKDGYIYRNCPNAYATYRTDINVPLGLVKSKYEVVQNRDAFNFFDEAIGEGKALWQYAGMFGYGHKIFVCAKLPIETQVNGDPIDNYLVFSNSHDGSSSITIMFTPIRVFCTNCLNAGLKSTDSYIRIRHTESAKEKIERGSEILRIACENAKTSQELYSSLSKINMSDDEVLRYICELVLSKEEYMAVLQYDSTKGFEKLKNKNIYAIEASKVSITKANKIATIYDYYFNGVAQENIIGTGWGAYNAITGYFSNVVNLEGEKRMDSLLWNNGNRVTQNAIETIFNLKAA